MSEKFPETMRVAVLSTAHMTPHDAEELNICVNARGDVYGGASKCIVDSTPYGWFVHILSEESLDAQFERLKSFSSDFVQVMQAAKEEHYQKVLFDRDGPVSEHFAKHDW